jgi:hypothetical protein
MRIIESRVRSCIEEHIIIDKKMKERKFKYKRYHIPLNDDQPFLEDETVVILLKSMRKNVIAFISMFMNLIMV